MADFFKKFLGNKSQKDIKVIMPYVDAALEFYEEIKKLSNDELREKTVQFKQRIAEHLSDKGKEIEELKIQLYSDEIEIDEKEKLYSHLDKLENESYELTQEILNEILPEAFAVMKDTARRFVENEYVEVTANQTDRDFAAMKANVEIAGDMARYNTSWLAGGNMIRWDMIHYDVQLIGGGGVHKLEERRVGEEG